MVVLGMSLGYLVKIQQRELISWSAAKMIIAQQLGL